MIPKLLLDVKLSAQLASMVTQVLANANKGRMKKVIGLCK
jgi:hypothetical protein